MRTPVIGRAMRRFAEKHGCDVESIRSKCVCGNILFAV